MSEIIKTEGLSFRYHDMETDALHNISLSIEKGSFTVILGHNGSGKSTLSRMFNGLLLPTEGRVYIDGIDTSDENRIFDVRRKIGMVFQNPDNQIVASIVEDDVAFGPENLGVPSDEIRERVDASLKAVGMYDYRLHSPHHLPGGQKQRAAIAGALAMLPARLILHAPTA
ncbi:MAG: ATP-binding cassette domain-containing protein, partial [Oscillospiraceae bacterium]|nr:ATP-binding cassette domain-containing protein [Oscillospiraceae bacterium]